MAFFFIAQDYFYALTFDREMDLANSLCYETSYYYTWALLLLIIIPLANRFPLEKNKLLKNLTAQLVFAVLFALVHRMVSMLAYLIVIKSGTLIGGLPVWQSPKVIGGSFNSFINYWVIIGLYYAFTYYKQYRAQTIKSAELEAELANSQLQALRMQLQPHFLFNTLHAVSSLMDENIGKARTTLTLLSNLLRQSLDNIGKQYVSLKEELDFLKSYLEIEQTRFEDRLTVVYDIDEDTLSCMIPNLLLQPLVENAIKHGIAPKAEGGTINVTAKLDNDNLYLSVSDDGKGCEEVKNKGIGLSNIQNRLVKIYGDNHTFKVLNKEGFSVEISIPIIQESE